MTKEKQLIKAIADVVSGLRSEIETLQSEKERLIKEVENRVVKCILDDIDFGYDLATIKGKIKSGSYVGNSPETFKENEMLKAERDSNWISLERAKKYARHQHYLGTQGNELVEFEDWECKPPKQ